MICSKIQDIAAGRKVQMRRLKKAGDSYTSAWQVGDVLEGAIRANAVYSASGHIKWQIGRDYAVQPGRGKPGVLCQIRDQAIQLAPAADYEARISRVGLAEAKWQLKHHGYSPLRIRVLDIRQEDVRAISTEDAVAEGFDSSSEFLRIWCAMHDKQAMVSISPNLKYMMQLLIMERPAERYQGWVLDFETVQP